MRPIPLISPIVALRNEKGSYNERFGFLHFHFIVALRNEKGSYNSLSKNCLIAIIVALRNEKGSYNSVWYLYG